MPSRARPQVAKPKLIFGGALPAHQEAAIWNAAVEACVDLLRQDAQTRRTQYQRLIELLEHIKQ